MIVATGNNESQNCLDVNHPSQAGLRLLYQAHSYARDVGSTPWAFAVEIRPLLQAGMTRTDFRWLIHKGYALHALEIDSNDRTQREFRSEGIATFGKRSCFCLTESGANFVTSLFQGQSGSPTSDSPSCAQETLKGTELQIEWDGERHQFFVNGQLVKEYKVPSPNQETILSAFQEDSWPIRIDDPLPPTGQVDGKRRLHDTIKSLNRNQKQPLIRFIGDGTGTGVRWELVTNKER